jgi:hypothetical protein
MEWVGMSEPLYIVEVDDRCEPRLVGHGGCSYTSPPQSVFQALALVRVLIGGGPRGLAVDQSPWYAPIAGGRRTITLHAVEREGQLVL